MSDFAEETKATEEIEENDGKKINFWKVLGIVILLLLFIYTAFTCLRTLNLKHNIKKYYGISKFTITDYRMKPESKEVFNSYFWYGDEIKYPLFYFSGKESNENYQSGYTDFFGNLVLDSFAEDYYHDDIKNYFINSVDFKNNFPDVKYFVSELSYNRMTLTKESRDFDGYLHSSVVYCDFVAKHIYGGYPNILVYLNTDDYDMVLDIKRTLRKNNFPVYIEFRYNSELTDETKEADVHHYSKNIGDYYPFGETYDAGVLGEPYIKEYRLKYKDTEKYAAYVQIIEDGNIETDYVLYANGNIVKTEYHGDTKIEMNASLYNEDYQYVYRFFSTSFMDNYKTDKDDVKSGPICNVYLRQGMFVTSEMEFIHMDCDYKTKYDEEVIKLGDKEINTYHLYSVKANDEVILPLLFYFEKYFTEGL